MTINASVRQGQEDALVPIRDSILVDRCKS
jgi:hypothetical protein